MPLRERFVLTPHFFKALCALALPIALQDLIKFSLALTDNLMVGSISQDALSAVTLANQPFFVFSLLSFGLSSGGGVLAAQYFGKGDKAAISKTVSITLSVGILCACFFGFATLLFPTEVMRVFTNDAHIAALGADYLRIQGWTYFLFGFSNTLLMLMRSTRDVRPGLYIASGAFFANLFFNWVLIFGHLGFPALGVKGAAIGTLLARAIECTAAILYIRFYDKHLGFRFKKLFHFDKLLFKDFIHYSIPVAVNEGGWALGIAAQSVVLGHLNSSVIAASSIVATAQQIALVVIFGIAGAGTPIIGNLLGSGKDKNLVKPYANTILLSSIATGLIAGTLLLLIGNYFFIPLYQIPAETQHLASILLLIQCLTILTQSYTTPAIVGILRAGGDTIFTSTLDIGSLWLFAIPLGYLAGFHWALPVPFVFLLLHSDEIVKLPILIRRVQRRKWIRNITR